jgi:hypothetical protein
MEVLLSYHDYGTRLVIDNGVSSTKLKEKKGEEAMTNQIELNVEEMEVVIAPGLLFAD